ncbi:LLM class flavin-dependent oxidoreductase [Plantactinospora siamensis]|uniref:LLM class flavin-dependent oxidoreductase n=1 Tax=Plantactinospora siamensis TaxID=555372 RepID=A0ABV6P2N0_9ACTN
MVARYAIGLPTVGEFGAPQTLLDLATAAERYGWDGVHLWDHLLYHRADWPVTSSTVAAAAIAGATTRLRIILTVALPRRQVQDVARDAAAIDELSGRRLTLLATIGSMDREYADFGLDPDLRARGRTLDRQLARLTELWTDWGVPGVPIWCGGRWPNTAGLRRAARFDGVMPTFAEQRTRNVAPADFAAAAEFVRARSADPVEIAVEGATTGAEAAGVLQPYVEAGLTWWVEATGWWRGGPAAAMSRIAAGPPTD